MKHKAYSRNQWQRRFDIRPFVEIHEDASVFDTATRMPYTDAPSFVLITSEYG